MPAPTHLGLECYLIFLTLQEVYFHNLKPNNTAAFDPMCNVYQALRKLRKQKTSPKFLTN